MWLPSVPWHELVVMTNGKEFIQDARILILSYDLLTRQTDVLKRMNFGMLILVCWQSKYYYFITFRFFRTSPIVWRISHQNDLSQFFHWWGKQGGCSCWVALRLCHDPSSSTFSWRSLVLDWWSGTLKISLNSRKSNLKNSSHEEYGKRYCDGTRKAWGMDYNGSSNMDELNVILKECFLIRRLKKNVLTQLPGKFR